VSTHGTVSDIRRDVQAIASEFERSATNTQIMVSEIHRTVVKGQGDGDNKNLLVSDTRTNMAITERPLIVAQAQTRSGI